jgi:uncharacterized membrane protein (UPF0127 family)
MARLIRKSDRVSIASDLKFAESYFSRLKGLIGKKHFVTGEGLLFPRCNSVHMWMMSVPIDVVFLKSLHPQNNGHWEVMSVYPGLKPWKITPVSDFDAHDALEIPAGVAASISLKKGDVLCIDS